MTTFMDSRCIAPDHVRHAEHRHRRNGERPHPPGQPWNRPCDPRDLNSQPSIPVLRVIRRTRSGHSTRVDRLCVRQAFPWPCSRRPFPQHSTTYAAGCHALFGGFAGSTRPFGFPRSFTLSARNTKIQVIGISGARCSWVGGFRSVTGSRQGLLENEVCAGRAIRSMCRADLFSDDAL